MTRDIDFPVMLERLRRAGITAVDISKATGINTNEIKAVIAESRPAPDSWQHAFKLLNLWLETFPRGTQECQLPIYGEYNP